VVRSPVVVELPPVLIEPDMSPPLFQLLSLPLPKLLNGSSVEQLVIVIVVAMSIILKIIFFILFYVRI